MILYVCAPYAIVSSHSEPGSAIANGRTPARRIPAKAAVARYSVCRGTARVSSITARNGTATSANCFNSTAAPTHAAARTYLDRVTKAKASTVRRTLGASAVPNQAPRIASGLATRAAPRASFHGDGASKASAATKSASVQRSTKTR